MSRLDGKLAVVTGGSGWLGTTICDTLTELGATTVSVGRSSTHPNPAVRVVELDMSLQCANDRTDLEARINEAVSSISGMNSGHIDILVNNMCSWPNSVDFMTTDLATLGSSFDSNVTAQLGFTQAIVAEMLTNGTSGSIINIASMYGSVSPQHEMYRGQGGNALMYGASKAALIQATKYLAALLGKDGIRVNAISPGPFPRAGALDGKEWFERELNARTMLGRVASPHELKGVIALLASDLGSFITGANIPVDGGWTAW